MGEPEFAFEQIHHDTTAECPRRPFGQVTDERRQHSYDLGAGPGASHVAIGVNAAINRPTSVAHDEGSGRLWVNESTLKATPTAAATAFLASPSLENRLDKIWFSFTFCV